LLLLTSCPNNTAHSLIGYAVIFCNFSQWFALVNTLQNGRPLSNRYLPMRIIWPWSALLTDGFSSWVFVDENVISVWE
jgi:hypothetical protein